MTIQKILNESSWNKKIEVLRILKGWSQQEAAGKIVISQKNYWEWETGRVYPGRYSRKVIAEVFGVYESEIFNKDKDKKVPHEKREGA